MSYRFGTLAAGFALLGTSLLVAGDARACGGFFTPATQTQAAVVAGHRMAFAIATGRTILWDQIKYTGSPADFAWVLPVKPGAVIEASTDAWFEALDAVTNVQVSSPPANCPDVPVGCSFGCGAADKSGSTGALGVPSPVTVVHEGTVGPYESVTLHADVPGALSAWLTAKGYAIDATAKPVIDAYSAQGFDFIALRLQPGQGIQQMKPVRVVAPGASPTLPLRMTAAGAGPNVALTLFVIGEGRYEIANFPNATVSATDLTWDFVAGDSNYATVRQQALAAAAGHTWLTVFSKQGALLSQLTPQNADGPVSYQVGTSATVTASTLEQLYFAQGIANAEAGQTSCPDVPDLSASTDPVETNCPFPGGLGGGIGIGGGSGLGGGTGTGTGGAGATGGSSGTGGAGGSPCVAQGQATDPSAFVCGKLDDLAQAMTFEHPANVWLTRLEANLPYAALSVDLNLQASASQQPQENRIVAATSTGSVCGDASTARNDVPQRTQDTQHANRAAHRRRDRGAMFFAIGATLFGTFARRRRRPDSSRS